MIIKDWIDPILLLFVGALKRNFVINGLAAFSATMRLGSFLLSPSLRLTRLEKTGHHGHGNSDFSAVGINSLGIEHLSFLDVDQNMVLHDHGEAHNHLSRGHSMI